MMSARTAGVIGPGPNDDAMLDGGMRRTERMVTGDESWVLEVLEVLTAPDVRGGN